MKAILRKYPSSAVEIVESGERRVALPAARRPSDQRVHAG